MNHEERTKRADDAKRILGEPAVQNAFNELREGLVCGVESCGWADHDKKNNLMLSLQLLKSMKKLFEKHIEDGKVSQKEIERMNNPRIKRAG